MARAPLTGRPGQPRSDGRARRKAERARRAAVAGAGIGATADTPAGLRVVDSIAEAQAGVDAIGALRAGLPFGIDGV
ncbi:hypothetical protein AB1388_14025, partial [Streptomyces hydrogenans]|uniref:hypothetical protein n=1 Tax=Streptomyces hydrogenans TaxID=1873719 RepID=UPI00345D1AE6